MAIAAQGGRSDCRFHHLAKARTWDAKADVSTYTYTAKAGYKGSDAFAVSFTGKGALGFWRVSNHNERDSSVTRVP